MTWQDVHPRTPFAPPSRGAQEAAAAARTRGARGRGAIVLISGLNLPTLLDYLHNRDQLGVAELAERLLQRGRDSIRLQRAPS